MYTLPSSHWTRIWFSPKSSTIQPRTKAVCGSFNHTYRFPEKSFSPSMLFTTSEPRRISSVLMNDGANVFEVGVPFLELDLCRDSEALGGSAIPASEE